MRHLFVLACSEKRSQVAMPFTVAIGRCRRAVPCAGDGLDALNEVWVTERALRFEQVQYLEYQFVYGAIFGGEAEQPLRENKALL